MVPSRTVQPAETFNIGTLKVERFGSTGRIPLIMIPGLYCGSWEFNGPIADLAAEYDIYAITLSGMDGRPRNDVPSPAERAIADLHRLISQRNLVRPIIIGHSLGGTLAVLFGERFGDEARGIIAVEGGYPIAPTATKRKQQSNALAAAFDDADPATFDRVLRTTQLQYVITDKHDVDTVAKLAERSDPTAIAQWLRAALSLDLTPKLSAIRVPFREIVPFDHRIDPYLGDKTLSMKQARYQTWVRHAPHGSVVMIDRSRHFVLFDQPQAFERALRATIATMIATVSSHRRPDR